MNKHPFENTHRLPAKDVSELDVQPWAPPMIDAAGHLVQVEPRANGRREGSQAQANQGNSREAYEQGFAKGKAEGFAVGKDEGLAAGKQEGTVLAQQELKPKLSELNKLLSSIAHSLNEEDYKLEQTLMSLVRVIAEAVIRRELQTDPRHIMKVIKETLSALPPNRDNIRILVNPADKALVDEAISHGGENWSAVADEEINRGGCRVETDQSVADFTIEARIESVLEQIYEQQAVSPKPGDPDFEAAPEPAVSARPQSKQDAATITESESADGDQDSGVPGLAESSGKDPQSSAAPSTD